MNFDRGHCKIARASHGGPHTHTPLHLMLLAGFAWPCKTVAPAAPSPAPAVYLKRNVILPLERSYGEISHVTLSPGRILM